MTNPRDVRKKEERKHNPSVLSFSPSSFSFVFAELSLFLSLSLLSATL